jgi:hypothetical protein
MAKDTAGKSAQFRKAKALGKMHSTISNTEGLGCVWGILVVKKQGKLVSSTALSTSIEVSTQGMHNNRICMLEMAIEIIGR